MDEAQAEEAKRLEERFGVTAEEIERSAERYERGDLPPAAGPVYTGSHLDAVGKKLADGLERERRGEVAASCTADGFDALIASLDVGEEGPDGISFVEGSQP